MKKITKENARAICPKCGGAMEQQARQQRSLIDLVGASVLSLLIVGFAYLFLSTFGVGGGRYGVVVLLGVPAFILWAILHMVGSHPKVTWHCPSCSPKE